jgi:hypothetical protein
MTVRSSTKYPNLMGGDFAPEAARFCDTHQVGSLSQPGMDTTPASCATRRRYTLKAIWKAAKVDEMLWRLKLASRCMADARHRHTGRMDRARPRRVDD